MIESITIKNVATFHPEDGVFIDELKKTNFIYGANGSGKTTIANYLEKPSDDNFRYCNISWKNGRAIKTLVYNKNFRERNFGKGKLEGIFTLGEATKEEQQVIADKTEELSNILADGEKTKGSLDDLRKKKEQLENQFKEYFWRNIYKKYDGVFKEAFKGAKRSKEVFKEKILDEFKNNDTFIQPYDELVEKAATIFGEPPEEMERINAIDFNRIVEIENNSIWKKIIIGKSDVEISRLIQKLNISDWVNQGRSYLQENENCPFCQQPTITADFRAQLEQFFDETYQKDLQSIKELQQEYTQLTSNVINELNAILSNQKELKSSKLNIDKFSSYFKTFESQNAANNAYLINKIKEPSRVIELVPQKEQIELISELISTANNSVRKHNAIVADFRNQRKLLIKSVWSFLVEEFRENIENYLSQKTGIDNGIRNITVQLDNKRREYQKLNLEIKQLSKNVTSIKPTIDEINRLLENYGFDNFVIVPSSEDGYYQIQREDGSLAEATLSEGEITFITFLYYLQRAKGGTTEDNVNEDRVLIIDDPISSLDSNVLFIVSTLIKEILKDVKAIKGTIKQVILFTHNVYFHKEVSFEGLHRKGEKPYFWILRKNNKITNIQAYKEQNPIQSSYELLWREIQEWESNSGTTIQNTMRRILEHFFNILGNRRDDYLIGKFKTREEKEICRSLLSWINEGSHTLPDDLYVETPDGTITKYLDVFKNIFVHTENIGHYKMMMGINEELEID